MTLTDPQIDLLTTTLDWLQRDQAGELVPAEPHWNQEWWALSFNDPAGTREIAELGDWLETVTLQCDTSCCIAGHIVFAARADLTDKRKDPAWISETAATLAGLPTHGSDDELPLYRTRLWLFDANRTYWELAAMLHWAINERRWPDTPNEVFQ